MGVQRLTEKDDWEALWEGLPLPRIARPSADVRRLLHRFLPRSPELTLLEIGCAPGQWMAFFHKQFGFAVSGIEYADNAVQATRKNLELLGVPGHVAHADFFEYDASTPRCDIVFSGGFIEHFDDLPAVVGKLCALPWHYVVTIIPNYLGLNGWISKMMSPQVYAVHRKIDRALLCGLHEQAGLQTLFCDSIGGLKFKSIAPRTEVSSRRTPLWRLLDAPRAVFNGVSELLSRAVGYYPRTRLLSIELMYVGRKRFDCS